jgi:Leucine-rich repeat (LRR) protein
MTITGTGAFDLQAGGTLRTAHIDGFNGGAIQVSGARTYATGANYIFAPPAGPDRDFNIATAQCNNLTTVAGGTSRVNANLQVNGTFTGGGRTAICGPTLTLQGPGSLSNEMWLGGGNLTVNGTLNVNATGILALVGPGGGCGSGNINGTGTISYAPMGILTTAAGWTGTLDTPEIPTAPATMDGNLNLDGAGGPITIDNNLRMAGNITLHMAAGNNMVMAAGRILTLEGAGVVNAPVSKIQVDNAATAVVMRHTAFNSSIFNANYVQRLVVDNAANVTMTNSLTIGTGGLDFPNSGNLIVPASTTLTLEGAGGTHVTGAGAGRVNATVAGAVVELTGNPLVDGAKFVQPIQTLRTGVTPPAAPSLNTGTFSVNTLDHANGSLVLTVPMTVNTGGTIAAGPPARVLDVASFGRLVLPNTIVINNNGTLNVQSAGTLEIQGTGNIGGTNPVVYANTGARGTLLYSGGLNSSTTGLSFPNTMPGNVVIDRPGGSVVLFGASKTVQGLFSMQNGVFDMGTAALNLTLSGSYDRTAGVFRSTTNLPSLTVNCDASSGIFFQATPNNQLNTLTGGATTVRLGSDVVANNVLVPAGTLDVFTTRLAVTGPAASTVTGTLNVAAGGTLALQGGASMNNTGAVTMNGGATLNIQDNPTFSGVAPTYTATTSILSYSGTVGKITGAEFPNTMNGSVIAANTFGTFQQTGPTTKNIQGNFTFQGAGIYSLNGAGNTLIINGTLTNTAASDFQAFNDNLTINGPVTNPLRTTTSEFNTLTFNPGSGNVVFGTNAKVNGVLTIDGGLLDMGANALTLNSPAVGSLQGGPFNATRHVVGGFVRAMNAAGTYTFPVGKGGQYLPLTVTNPGALSTIRVEAFNVGSGGTAGPGLATGSLSATEYWRTDIVAGSWNAGSTVTVQPAAAIPAGRAIGRASAVGGLYGSIGPALFAGGPNITSAGFTAALPAVSFFALGTQLAATELRYIQQPSNVSVNGIMSPPVIVAATDAAGNIDNTYTGTVTLVSPNLVGSPVMIPLVNGVASFSSLQFSMSGGPQTMQATGPLPFVPAGNSVSSNFTVTPLTPWACITAPTAPPSPAVFNGFWDRNLTISNFQFTSAIGAPVAGINTRIVPPGAVLAVQFDYNVVPTGLGCTGCVTQYYLGLPGAGAGAVLGGAGMCFHNAIGGGGGAGITRTFTAPTTPGVYYISAGGSWQFLCNDAVGFGNTPTYAVGYIIVENCANSDMTSTVLTPTVPYVGFTTPAVVVGSPNLWQLTLRDGGANPDADPYGTSLSSITFQVDDAQGVIQNLALFVGGTKVSADVAPSGGFATFTGLTGINAPDNGAQIFTLKASYKTTPTTPPMDGAQIRFQVTGAMTAAAGSSLAAATVGWSGYSTVDVVATKLDFMTTPPTSIPIGVPMMPVQQVAARDVHNNLDINWAGTVTLSNPFLAPSAMSMAAGGLVNFGSLTFNAPAVAQTLTANSAPPLTAGVSGLFDIAQPIITVDSASLNFGRIPVGSFVEREIKVSGIGMAGNLVLTPQFSTLATLSLTGGIAFSTQPTITLVPTGTSIATTSIFVRFTANPPDTLTRTGQLRLAAPLATSIALTWTGVGISPHPRALAFDVVSSTATLGIPGAWQSAQVVTVRVGAFRSDDVLAGVPTTSTVQLFANALPGGNAQFIVDMNNTGSSTATFARGDASLNLLNVRIIWLNGPAQGGTTTATITMATISGYQMISTQTTITVTVDRTLPVVSAITPAYQGVGRPVVITGSGFAGAIKVIVGNVSQQNFRVDSPTQITVFGLTTGTVTGVVAVETNGGADSIRLGNIADTQAFEFARPPSISSFFPAEQAGGGVVSIIGQNYMPAIKTSALNPIIVQFGSRPAMMASPTSSSTLLAQVGLTGESGRITVTTIGGSTSSTQTFTFVNPPIIADFSPKFGQRGTVISVTGANFIALTDTAAIKVGGVSVDSYRVINRGLNGTTGEIRFTLNEEISGPIQIQNIAGSTSSTMNFTYVEPPVITEFSPMTSATGKVVTITGKNFIEVKDVSFGGIKVAGYTVPSSTAIVAVVGNGTNATLRVENIVGATTSTQVLDFVRPPLIRSFSPRIGGAGVWVTITGANFRVDSTKVEFIGTAVDSVIVDSSGTRLRARVAASGASQGSLIVSNLAGSAIAAELFRYVPPPEIQSFDPEEGTTGATITLTGAAFVNMDSVTVGGVRAADVEVLNESKLLITLDSGARGPIRVFTLQGAATTATVFRFVYKDTLPPPRITRFTPLTGRPGDTVTIRGVNFNVTRNVLFGGVTAASFRVISPSELRATLPTNATTGSVTVITPFGVTTSTIRFTFQPVTIIPQPTPLGQDSIALVQFYLANHGATWSSVQGWLKTVNPSNLSTWTGVTVERVDTSLRITAVRLPNRGITGTLPSSIAQLTRLRVLDVSSNQISGSIPVEISTIATLQELRLSNNQLTNTISGQVIDRLDSMQNLRILRLDGNRFVSSLPEGVCKLPQLQELSLAGNQFGGRIPACWFTMAGLQVLDLSRNMLDGPVPPELGQLQSLRELSLAGNAFSGQIPQTLAASTSGTLLAARKSVHNSTPGSEIAALPQLTKLDLSNNQLTGEIPQSLWTLTALQELNLSVNRLRGTVPASIRQLSSLRVLNLSRLQLGGTLPRELEELTNLQTLILDSNRFEARLPSLSRSRPQQVSVAWNQFTNLADLNTLSSLRALSVEGNRLTFDVLEPLAAMRSLTAFTYTPQDSLGTALDTIGLAGRAFRYTVRTGGRANSYQWFKNNLPLDQVSTVLALDNFKESDAGTYICRVTNANVQGLALWTRPLRIAFSLPTPPRSAPTLLSPPNDAQNVQIPSPLVWSRVADVLTYRVEIRDDSTNTVMTTADVSDTTVRVSGLSHLTRYNWRVRGINAGGEGPTSAISVFRTVARGAVLSASGANFGRVVLGRPAERRTLQITNLSTAPLTLVSIAPQEDVERNFVVTSQIAHAQLLPNQSLAVDVEFQPRSHGQKTAALVMTYLLAGGTPQSVRQEAALTGQGGALDIQNGAFGTVLLGRGAARTLLAINRSSAEARITGARLVNSGGRTFVLGGAVPETVLRAGDTATIPMRCVSEREQFAIGEVEFQAEIGAAGNRSTERATGLLSALVRAEKLSDLLYNVQLKGSADTVAPGLPVTLRLQLYSEDSIRVITTRASDTTKRDTIWRKLSVQERTSFVQRSRSDVFNNATNPTITLLAQFDKNVLALASDRAQRAYYTGDLSGTIATIKMIVRWDGASPILAEIPCVAVNGATDVTRLRLLDLQWAAIGGREMFPVFDSTTTFTAGICDAGGKRLVRQTNVVALSKASPNPVSDETKLIYSIREQGQTTLTLYDIKGTKLKEFVNAELAPGEYTLVFRVDELPSGTYIVILETPTARIDERVEVVK